MSASIVPDPVTKPARVDRAIALGLAAVAAIWHALLMTRAANDNFLHLTLAQQWLHGDWPVRDFFDQGWVLQYTLSALAMLAFGHRLGAEAVIVGVSWAISTWFVYTVVRRLTASTAMAATAALLPIVASARGYSYPKGIVYAVAAALWWRYVDRPSIRGAIELGLWAAIAFYWRPDHGIYVAIGLTLAMTAAHGVSRLAVTRTAVSGATMVACLVPFFVYVQAVYGLVPYARTGLVAAEVEHVSQGTHEWPLVRYGRRLVSVEPAGPYAPVIGIRWRSDSAPEQRQQLLARYALTPVASSDNNVVRVRLSASSLSQLRGIVNDPIVEDTDGIDRGAGVLSASTWTAADRWTFTHWWLRVRLLPDLDRRTRASEFTAALFLASPLLLLIAAPWLSRRLHAVRTRALVAFAGFALLVAWAMVRNPFPARVADAVVLSSIAGACCLGGLWSTRGRVGRAVLRAVVLCTAALVVWIVAASGQFAGPASWIAGARVTWDELTATPPLAHYLDRPARFTLRLAAYVRDCVPPSDRLVVLWFEPEIYYYSDRLMALRHPVFAPAWSALADEQRATLDKVERFKPPLVLARRSALDEYARATYPGVMAYVEQQYTLAATAHDSGEDYLIYARRDRPVVRTFGTQPWPCFTPAPSRWERVGPEP